MWIVHLAHHRLVHIRDCHLIPRRWVSNCLFCAIDFSLLHLVRLNALRRGCILAVLLPCSALLIYLAVSFLFILVQILDKLLHCRNRIVARVVAAGRDLLLLCHDVVGAVSPQCLDDGIVAARTSPT